jgi:hypothetical protein
MSLGDPQQWNAYSYATNSPITGSDPSGLMTKVEEGGRLPSVGFWSAFWNPQNLASYGKGFLKGYGGGPKNTIKGIWNALTNPIGTVAGFKAQLSHYDPAGVNTSGAGACVALGICQLMEQLVISAQTGDLEGAGEAMGDFTFGVAMGAATDGIGRALGGLGLLGKLSRWARFEPDTTPTPGRPIRPVSIGCHSFAPTTAVLLGNGTSKPIADIRVGDLVLATDPLTGEQTPKPVTALHVNHDWDLAEVTIYNQATGDTNTLKTTWNHPFWSPTTSRWINASDLRPGDRFSDDKGNQSQIVVAVRTWIGMAEMRDLTVNQLHTYYVLAGNTPILVHNDNGDDLVRVGRWMSQNEYDRMLRTGMVQPGAGGLTYVVHPASADGFIPNRPGSVYAEFDVPRSSLLPGGRPGDYKMAEPDTLMGRYLSSTGGTPGMPEAKNISLGGGGAVC